MAARKSTANTPEVDRNNATDEYPVGKARGPEVDGSFPDLSPFYSGAYDPTSDAAAEGDG